MEINSLSAPLIILTIFLLPLIIIASYQIFHTISHPRLFTLLLVFLTLTLLEAFITTNIIYFYVFFELSLIPTAFLIIIWGYQPERIPATFYLLIYIISFSLPLLVIIIYFYHQYYTLRFILNFSQIPTHTSYPNIISLGFLLALLIKLPIFIAHL